MISGRNISFIWFVSLFISSVRIDFILTIQSIILVLFNQSLAISISISLTVVGISTYIVVSMVSNFLIYCLS